MQNTQQPWWATQYPALARGEGVSFVTAEFAERQARESDLLSEVELTEGQKALSAFMATV